VRAAQSEARTESRNQQRREQERAALEARLRERGPNEVISLPQRDGEDAAGESDPAAGKYLPRHGTPQNAPNDVIPFTPRVKKSGGEWKSREEWQADWKKRKEREDESPHNRGGNQGSDELVARTLARAATGELSGAVKAERGLLRAMLAAPSQRVLLLERIRAYAVDARGAL
jgi:hypothetical protein